MPDATPSDDGIVPLVTLGLLALAVLAAGCIGSTETSPEPETVVSTTSDDTEILRPASFPLDTVNRTAWTNGSFSQAEIAAGQADREQRIHRVSLGELPEDAPVRVSAELRYDAPTEATTGVDRADVFVDAQIDPDADYPLYEAQQVEAEGSETLEATLVTTGSTAPELLVVADAPPGETELAYTLRYQVQVPEHVVPAQVAVAVDVPAEAERIEVLPREPSQATTVRAWTPEDAYVGSVEITDDAGSVSTPLEGSYVVLPNASATLRLVDDEGDPLPADGALRPLGWSEETGEAQRVLPGGAQTWNGDLVQAPLAIGFTMRSEADPLWVLGRTTIEMEGPSGDLPTVTCNACVFLGSVDVRAGFDDDQRAGTYEIQVESALNTELEVVPRWLHYRR